MNELFLATPLLNTLDLATAIIFLFMAAIVGYFFQSSFFPKRAASFKILLSGYSLAAIILFFKILMFNSQGHSIYEKPGTYMILLIIQFYIPPMLFFYQKIVSRNFSRQVNTGIFLFTVTNIAVLWFKFSISNRLFIILTIILAIGLLVLNLLFYTRAIKISAKPFGNTGAFRSTYFMFSLTSLFAILCTVLCSYQAVRLFYYVISGIYVVISLGYLTTVVVLVLLGRRKYVIGKVLTKSPKVSLKDEESFPNNDERFILIRERLDKYIEDKKPYLDRNLKIEDLSLTIYTNKTYLSRVINHYYDMNFNQFINRYRVKEAIRIFNENHNVTMEELCSKAGFGSMATFSVSFRVFTNETPAEWCRNQKIRERNEAGR